MNKNILLGLCILALVLMATPVEALPATYQFSPVSGQLVTGTEQTITSATASNGEGVNVGSWKGTLADDNFHWVVGSLSPGGVNVQLDVGKVQLNGANTFIIQTEFDLDSATLATQVQICDWVSSTGADASADAQCTGGWRSLNNRNVTITTTSATAYNWQIYDGYWAMGNTPVSTPLSNFVNDSGIVKLRYYSTGAVVSTIAIDYLRIYAVINPVYTAANFTNLGTGAVTGDYRNTTAITQGASDNVRLTVAGTAGTISDFYLSFKNVKTYTGMNTILVRAEYSCSATGISHRPKIFNFTSGLWEDLTTASIACSTSDATNAWAKSNVNISDYISDGEIRVGWYGLSVGTQAIQLDQIYIMLGSVTDNDCEISFGSQSGGTCANTRDLDMTGTTNAWNVSTEDESTAFGHDYYPYDTDADATMEEAAASHVRFSVNNPQSTAVTGIFFAGRFMSGAGGTVQMGIRDYSGLTGTIIGSALGGFSAIGATATTSLVYTDPITVTGVGSGGYAGWMTNPEDHIDTQNGKMWTRLRTTGDGANTTNSINQWDFAMTSLQWIENAATVTYQFTPVSGQLVTGTEQTITSATASNGEGVNVGSWKGTLADDNFHWVVGSLSPGGVNVQLDVGKVQLNGANTFIIQTEFDLDSATLATQVQICDWVSSTGADASADAQCTGGWRSLNNRNVTITTTSATAYNWQIYDGYWAMGNTPVSTPLSNFVNDSGIVKLRYYSTGAVVSTIAIDYLRIYAVINPVYTAANFTNLGTGAVTGDYRNTTAITQGASDNTYLTVAGTAGTISNFYLSFKNVKTYTGMNTILVRAEYSCSATGINYRPKIFNFTANAWEDLTTASIACSTSDATNAWAKSNVNINDYISDGEIRVGWYGLSVGTQAIRLDQIYIMLGSVTDGDCEVSFGSQSGGTCANTRDLDMTGTTNAWNVSTEDESTAFGHDYYPYDTDADATMEEAAASHVRFSVNNPQSTAVTGIFFAGRFMSGAGGTVQMGIRDYSGLTGTIISSALGGFSAIGATATTSLVYTDPITVTGVGSGGYAGWMTNPEDHIDTQNGKMWTRLRTTADGANTTNSINQWDFAMTSLQWIENAVTIISPPTYSNNQTNNTNPSPNEQVLHSVLWSASSGTMSGYIFSNNYSGSWSNKTWTAFSSNWSNETNTSSSVGTYGWMVYANDSLNQWNDTGIQTITFTPDIVIKETGTAYSTIQSAINAATDGQTVLILKSKWFNENVVLNRSITLSSNSSTQPTINSSATSLKITANGATVSNLTIAYNGTYGWDENSNVVWITGNYATVANNTITMADQSGNYPVYILNSVGNIIYGNNITSQSYGSHAVYISDSSTNNTIDSNLVAYDATSSYGILIEANNNTIKNNNISSAGGYLPIYLDAYYDTVIIENNFVNNKPAVYNKTLQNLTITATTYGELILANSFNVTINSSSFTEGGILFLRTTNSTISNSNITTKTSAIVLDDSSDYNTIFNNNISTSGGDRSYGITLYWGGYTNITKNNITITGDGYNFGIMDYTSYNTITSNVIKTTGWGDVGIRLAGSYNAITNNNITTAAEKARGIWLDWGNYNNITSCNITTTGAGTGQTDNDDIQDYIPSALQITGGNLNTISNCILNSTNYYDIFVSGTANQINYIINLTYNKTDIKFNQSSNSKIYNQYYLDVYVNDSFATPLNSATVFGNDTNSVANVDNPTSNFTATTNSSGYITQQSLSEFMGNWTYNSTTGYLYFNNYTINASKTGFTNSSTTLNLTLNKLVVLTLTDNQGPQWSSNSTSIVSTYSPTLSQFNITWNDNGAISKVFLESNFSGSSTNYSMTKINSEYNYNNTLPAGTFYWKSYANDTSNNWNISSTWYFTINKTKPVLIMNNGTTAVNSSGLVGYWRFENESLGTATDYSGWNNTGTLTNMNNAGNATSGPTGGRFGKGMQFDGVNDYVNLSNSSVLNPTSGITVSGWINLLSFTSHVTRIVSKEITTNANPYDLEIRNAQQDAEFCIGNDTTEDCTTSNPVTLNINQWYFVTGTYDGSQIKIYVNGNLTGTTASSRGLVSATTNVLIGNNPTNTRQFNGTIDEVQIWNRSLTADEINELYQSTVPYGTQTNFTLSEQNTGDADVNYDFFKNSTVAGVWHFDEGSGNTTVDSSGNGNNGNIIQLNNGVYWDTGKFGSGLRFNNISSGQYVDINNNSIFNPTNALTIETWVKLNSNLPSTSAKIIYKTQYVLYQEWDTPNTITLQLTNSTGSDQWISANNLPLNQWLHVVATYDSSLCTRKIYVNGTLANSGTNFCGPLGTSTNDLQIGDIYFNGTIDEVRIYPRALSPQEILCHFGNNCTQTVFSNETAILPAGYHYYSAYTAGGQNYTTSAILLPLNITPLPNPIDIYFINSTGTYKNQNMTVSTGTQITANATMTNSNGGTANLYLDNSLVSNPNTTTLSGGIHSFTGNTTGAQNYSANSTNYYIAVGDFAAPQWQNQGTNDTDNIIQQGQAINLTAQGKDETALDWAWLSTNETGSWRNYTVGGATQTANWITSSQSDFNLGTYFNTSYNSTGGFVMLNTSDIDSYTKLMLHMNGADGSTTFTDEIGKSVTANGNAQVDNLTTSGLFDGSGDSLETPDHNDWNFGAGDLTVDFWLRVPSSGLSGTRILWSQSVSDTNENLAYFDGTNIYWYIPDISLNLNVAHGFSADVWYHIAYVRSGNTWYIFKNGTQIASTTNSGTIPDIVAPFRVGAYFYSATYDGWLDEFRVSKGIARWTSNFTPQTTPYSADAQTVLLLNMDAPPGSTTFRDSETTPKTVTTNGNAQVTHAQGKLNKSSLLKFTQAAVFDGSGDYLSAPDSADWYLGTGNFTIDFWVRFAAIPTNDYETITAQGGDYPNYWALYLRKLSGDSTPVWEFLFGGNDYAVATSVVINTWYHVALVRSGNSFYIFQDGTQVGSTGTLTAEVADYATILTIGEHPLGLYYLNGWIDELRISKGLARWTSNFTPPSSEYMKYSSGNYVSKIFDAGSTAQWNNISWIEGVPYGEELPNNNATETVLGGANMSGNVLLMHLNSVNSSNYTLDSSGNNNDGKLYNYPCSPATCNLTAGKFGNALGFDGSDDYVQTNDINAVDGVNQLTATAWVYVFSFPGGTADRNIVNKWSSGQSNFIFQADSAGTMYGFIANGLSDAGSNYGLGSKILANRWYHVAMVYNGSGATNADKLKIYINGSQDALTFTGTITSSLTSGTAPVVLGKTADGSRMFYGYMDDVAVWNRSLSATEILNIYKRGALRLNITTRSCGTSDCSGELWQGPYGNGTVELPNNQQYGTAGLYTINMTGNVLLMHLNSVNSTNYTLDSSGNNNDGKLYNYPCSPATCNLTAGKLNNSLSFDGVNDYIDSGSNSIFQNVDNHTVEAWVKSTKSGWQFIAGYYLWGGGGDYGYALVIETGGQFGFIEAQGGAWAYATSSSSYAGDGIWHHLVGVRRNGVAYVYVDGVEQPTTTALTPAFSSPKALIGWQGASGQAFGGIIDEVVIFNRSLSAAEILNNYKMGVPSHYENATYGNISFLKNNRYFQWKANFETDNTSYTPELYNVTVNYNATGGGGGNYNSPMNMSKNSNWQWSNFTWSNSSVADETSVGWRIYYNDTAGNANGTGIQTFTISNPPQVTILSPLNQSYSSSSIWANISLNKPASWCGVSLDGTANETLTNTTGNWNYLMTVASGAHNVVFYCNNTNGNMNFTAARYFTFNAPPIWQNQGTNDTDNAINQGEAINLTAQGKDETALDWAWLSTNETGSWMNYTGVETGTSWWNSSWTRRKNITINNSANSNTLTNYQAFVNVTYDSDMNSTFKDLRFTYYNSTSGTETETPYWIESNVSSSFANVWINVTRIANNSYQTIYMYYGNPSANSASSGTNTFEFFDDFPGSTINTTKWVEIDPDNSISQNDDLILNDVSESWTKALISQQTFSRSSDKKIYATLTIPADTAGDNHFMLGWELNQISNPSYDQLVHGFYWNNYLLTTYEKGAHTGPNTQSYSASTDYKMKVELKSTGAKYYIIGGAYSSWTLVVETSTYSDSTMRVAVTQYSHQANIHHISVQKYTSPEPNTTTNTEESYTGSRYNSPMNMTKDSNWQWSNFTWGNSSVPDDSLISWKIYYNDTAGNENGTNTMNFAISRPPLISILSPLNQSYGSSSVWANVTLNKAGSWCGAELDSTTNYTMSNTTGNWNYLMTSLTTGSHNVKFYCNSSLGAMNTTDKKYFYVDVTAPIWQNQGTNDTDNQILQGQAINLTAQGKDETALDWAWLATNETGQWKNYTEMRLNWWNMSWNYRKSISILNSSSQRNNTQYFINVSIPKNKIFTNFTDLRFGWLNETDNSEYQIAYCLGSDLCNGTTNVSDTTNYYIHAWVNIPVLYFSSIQSKNTIIRAYYNNSQAVNFDSLSNNITGLLVVYDEFSDGSINSNIWETRTIGGWTVTESSGQLHANSDADWGGAGVRTKANYTKTDYRFWSKMLYGQDPGAYGPRTNQYVYDKDNVTFEPTYYATPNNNTLFFWLNGHWNEKRWLVSYMNSTGAETDNSSATSMYTVGDYITAKCIISVTNSKITCDWYKNDVFSETRSISFSNVQADDFSFELYGYYYSAVSNSHWDWVKVTRMIDPEPTYSIGTEEILSATTPVNYNSPMDMNNAANTWTWSNFTWSNSSVNRQIIGWRIYYNDTTGNQNATDIQTFAVGDFASPIWQNQGTNDTDNIIQQGQAINLTAQGKDETALDWAWLATNETGVWQNKTTYSSPMNMSKNNQWQWSNFTWSNSSVAGIIIGWRIYYNDTSGNQNATDIMSFIISSPGNFVNMSLNATQVWWQDIVNASGFTNVSVSITVYADNTQVCSTISLTNGFWSCSFAAPAGIGTYSIVAKIGTFASSQIMNLKVSPSYGVKGIGSTPRVVYEVPFLIQNPNGNIENVFVRVSISK